MLFLVLRVNFFLELVFKHLPLACVHNAQSIVACFLHTPVACAFQQPNTKPKLLVTTAPCFFASGLSSGLCKVRGKVPGFPCFLGAWGLRKGNSSGAGNSSNEHNRQKMTFYKNKGKSAKVVLTLIF